MTSVITVLKEVGGAGSGVTRSTQAEGTDKSARVPPLLLRPNGWGVDAKGEWTPLEGHRAVRGTYMPISQVIFRL